MSKIDYDISRDLYELTTMALSLEQYITSEQVFYAPEGKFSKIPTMTLGTFLMRLRRISTLQQQLDVGERAQLGIAIQSHENILKEWAVHYQSKMEQELDTRIQALRTFLDDLSEVPGDSSNDLLPELVVRTAIEELLLQAGNEIEINPKFRQDLNIIDTYWESVTHDSYFHWDEKLRKVYPQEKYWWLYRELNAEFVMA